MKQDLLHGIRLLRRRPGFTIAAVLSLSLGIGLTTAIFTMLNAVVLRPLPYQQSERLMWMSEVLKMNSTDEVTITEHFLEWRDHNQSFTELAAYNYQTRNLTGVNEASEVATARVSASFLPLLGIQPVIGRNFLREEDSKGHEQVAILGHELWSQRFGTDLGIIGRSVMLDGNPYRVTGVLPPDFVFPGPDPIQLLTPLGKDEQAEREHRAGSIIRNVVGRLKPGVTQQQARAEMSVLTARLPLPLFRPTITLKFMPLRTWLAGDVAATSLVLLAAAAFLLLIACANVSNLLLARWIERNRELAIRSALGGSRARLVGQLLIESSLLGILACALGSLVAYWSRIPLAGLIPSNHNALASLPFDVRVFAFSAALGMSTTLLFGLFPALRVTRTGLASSVKSGETAVVGGRGSQRILSTIAATGIATTLILTAGSGLMLQSFWNLRYKNLGFRPDHIVAATLNLSGPAYRNAPRRSAFIEQLLERVQAMPGVELAAVARAAEIPPGEGHATNTFAIEGRNQPLGGSRPIARYPVVSSSYFAMMGIGLLDGRLPKDADGPDAGPIVVVNRALVERYFAGERPLGKRVRTGPDTQPWRTIVGVVGDVKTSGLAASPEPAIYTPYRQGDLGDLGILIRSPLSAGIIANEFRKVVASLDANQPIATVKSMDERLTLSVEQPRFIAVVLFAFASLAVILGLIGVYGVMGCRVRWQLRELAVRQALGAQHHDVILHVLRQGAMIVGAGLAVGLAGAIALTRLLVSMLYEVSPHDPLTLAAVSAALAIVALLACWIPATRAAISDPLTYLRQE